MAPAEPATEIEVTLAWSPQPRVVERLVLRLPADATVADALRASGVAELLAGVLDHSLQVAVWSKPRHLATPLRDADRIELTRGLRVDPKEARRQRYRQQPAGSLKRRVSAKG